MVNKNKFLVLVLFSIILLATVSAVGASELNASDDLTVSDTLDDVSLSDSSSSDKANLELSEDLTDSSSVNEDQTVSSSSEDDVNEKNIDNGALAQSNNEEIVADAPKTFTQLNTLINGNTNSTIHLDGDYKYTSSDSNYQTGITISRALTIIGDGYTIDCSNSSRAFSVSTYNVKFINVTFKNGGSGTSYSGGFIYSAATAYNPIAINSTFTNSKGSNGGALYYASAENCTFENCYASSYGGAIYSGNARNCTFRNCRVGSYSGGAIYSGLYNTNVTNCTFINNNAPYGGAVYSSSAINIINCNFTGNNATSSSSSYGGGAIYATSSTNTITNCTFSKNYAYSRGGAIYSTSSGTITDCNFTDNRAGYGGAVYSSSTRTIRNCNFLNNNGTYCSAVYSTSICSIFNCTFENNRATSSYGAIYSTYGVFNLTNCTFVNNTGSSGAAFYSQYNVNITNCSFVRNNASGSGGAVYASSSSNITNCNFSDNYANTYGAVYASRTRMFNCTFENNRASSSYGAVYVYNPSNVTKCTFINNSASGSAGALYASGLTNITNCTFTKNNASYGGAVYIGSTSNITRCTFENNSANYGGAIYASSILNLSGSTFVNNHANYYGGAINSTSSLNVSNCNFTYNNASYGGAISASYIGNISNSYFKNNTADYSGGAIYIFSTTSPYIVVRYCTFENNSAANGGAYYATRTNNDVINCTFSNNSARSYGGAVYGGNLVFCAMFNNTAPQSPNWVGSYIADILHVSYTQNYTYPSEVVISSITLYYGSYTFRDVPIFLEVSKGGKNVFNDTTLSYHGWSSSNFESGDYTIKVSLPTFYAGAEEEDDYLSWYIRVHLNGTRTNITVDNLNDIKTINASDDNYLIATLYANETGLPLAGEKVKIYFEYMADMNIHYILEETTDENGKINVSLKEIKPKGIEDYVVYLVYAGHDEIENTDTYFYMYVEGEPIALRTDSVTMYVGDDEYLVATMLNPNTNESISGKNVSVSYTINYVNYPNVYTTDENGQIIIPLKNIINSSTGYVPSISFYYYFPGDDVYGDLYAYGYVYLKKYQTTLYATNVTMFYGQEEYCTGKLIDDQNRPVVNATINIDVYYQGMYHVQTDENGEFIFKIPNNISAGSYPMSITYNGHLHLNSTSTYSYLNIKRYTTVIEASDMKLLYNTTGELVATLINNDTKEVITEYELYVRFTSFTGYLVTDENGQIRVPIPILSEGIYEMYISFSTTPYFNSTYKYINVTVSRYITSFNVTDITVIYNETPTVVATLYNESGEVLSGYNVSVSFNNQYFINTTDEFGNVYLDIPVLPNGTYYANFYFAGEGMLRYTSKTIYINVVKIVTVLNVSDVRAYYNEGQIVATLTNQSGDPLVDWNLYVSLNDMDLTFKTDSNGQAIIDLADLPGGNYIANLKFIGNELYYDTAKNVSVYVGVLNSNISSANIAYKYDEIGKLNLKLTDELGNPLAMEKITLKNDFIDENLTTDVNGEASLILQRDLLPGSYILRVNFGGNDRCRASSAQVEVNIDKLDTSILSDNLTFNYGEDGYLVVTLLDQRENLLANQPVSVNVGVKTFNGITDSDGTVRFLMDLPAKTWTATISFAEDSIYHASSAYSKIVINKGGQNPSPSPGPNPNPSPSSNGSAKSKVITDLVAPNLETVYKAGKYATATLKDVFGNPVSNAQIIMLIGGKTYYKTTDGNGQVKFLIDLVPKIYYGVISFEGDGNYVKSSVQVQVTVSKAKPKLIAKKKSFKVKSKVKKYVVTLKDNRKKAIKKAKLTLKVKGKTYKVKTNKKGKAVFKIKNLTKKGKFKAVIKYRGNKYYRAIKKTVKLTVK